MNLRRLIEVPSGRGQQLTIFLLLSSDLVAPQQKGMLDYVWDLGRVKTLRDATM
jgi:hypothetical protein